MQLSLVLFLSKRISLVGPNHHLLTKLCITVCIGMNLKVQTKYDFFLMKKKDWLRHFRLAWSLSISWMIFACVKGLGGPINTFLSWRAWAPLAKMSFCMYLIHMTVIVYYCSLTRYIWEATNWPSWDQSLHFWRKIRPQWISDLIEKSKIRPHKTSLLQYQILVQRDENFS